MAYTLKKRLANKKNYGGHRDTSLIKYIVIHYTGNDGDHDESNATYFQNNIVKASAHYFVDSDSVTQSVPDDYIAWSVGGNKYGNCNVTGGGSLHGKCTNTNSISIELCDDVKNGVIYPSSKTIGNAIELVKSLMKKYGIPASRVIRHFDVTGKSCPAYWCGSTEKNKKWKSEFHDKLSSPSSSTSSSSVAPSENSSFLVRVTVNELNIRTGAGAEYAKCGVIKDKGTYTIVETKKAKDGGTWGKLKSGVGWINISSKYVKKI